MYAPTPTDTLRIYFNKVMWYFYTLDGVKQCKEFQGIHVILVIFFLWSLETTSLAPSCYDWCRAWIEVDTYVSSMQWRWEKTIHLTVCQHRFAVRYKSNPLRVDTKIVKYRIQVTPDDPNWIFAKVNLLACEQSVRLPATSLWWTVMIFDKQGTSACTPYFI